MAKLRPITKEEYRQYDWIKTPEGVLIRGIKRVPPPDDGYVYEEVTTLGDKEQKWVRVMTIDEG